MTATSTAARSARRSRQIEPNGEVILPSAAQDYVLTSALGIGFHTTIRGPSAGLATIRLDAFAPPSHVISVGVGLTVAMDHLRVTGGRNDDEGGGIEVNTGATLNLVDSEIVGNRATSGGGIWSAGKVNLARTTVAGNTTTGDGSGDPGRGGGILIEGAGELINSTVSGNSASVGGGVYTSGPLTLQNATVAGNTATSGGGLHDLQGESVMRSTLVAANQGGACSGQPGGGAEEYNLADDASCGLDGTGDRVVSGTHVAPLADYGGPTRSHALYTGSAAVDAVPTGCLLSRPAACGASEPMRHRRVRGQHRLRTSRRRHPAAASCRRRRRARA